MPEPGLRGCLRGGRRRCRRAPPRIKPRGRAGTNVPTVRPKITAPSGHLRTSPSGRTRGPRNGRPSRAASHPDFNRRSRNSTGSAARVSRLPGGASGSRTVTAGSDFHRPRSTRSSSATSVPRRFIPEGREWRRSRCMPIRYNPNGQERRSALSGEATGTGSTVTRSSFVEEECGRRRAR